MNIKGKNELKAMFLLGFLLIGKVAAGQTPTISSVSPLSGVVSSSVTVTGTNFNSTASNNIVYFGATQATVTGATATSVTVNVPTGATYNSVSLLNNATGLQAYSPLSFVQSYNNSGFDANTVNFAAKVDIAAGPSGPNHIAIGDLDGDGKTDVLVVNFAANVVTALVNTSTSGTVSFTSAGAIASVANIGFVAIGDIDGDGKPDVVIPSSPGANVTILRNTSTPGSLSFAAGVTFGTVSGVNSAYISDIDGDGKPDIVTANQGNATVSVLRNTGSVGSLAFAAHVDFSTGAGSNATYAMAGDLDGDGKPDIVAANSSGSIYSAFRNTSTPGTISFAARADFTGGTTAVFVTLADIDGDGLPEILGVNQTSQNLSLFPNTSSIGSITMGSRQDFTTGPTTHGVSVGDFNGDGKPDIAVDNISSSNVSVFLNKSTGTGNFTLAPVANFATGAGPGGVAVGDIDGDGKADIVTDNQSTTTISVLRNDPFTSISGTASVCIGSTTTLSEGASGGKWVSGNTAIAMVGSATGIVTGVSGGTAVISYVGTAGTVSATNITTMMVTVNPDPITGTMTVCTGSATTLSDATSGGTWASSNAGLATVGSSSGVVTGFSPGTPTISYTAGGCTATATVTVYQTPTGISGTFAVCEGNSTTLTDGYGGGIWTSSNAGAASIVGATGVMTGVSAGNATITYTMPGSCIATQQVTVNPNPVSITGTFEICEGSTTTLSDATAGGAFTSSSTGFGTIGSGTGLLTGISGGTTNITYTLGSGCFTTAQATIDPLPAVITGSTNVCVGGAITLASATAGGAWSSSNTGEGSIDAVTGVVAGISAGTPTISYAMPTGCFVTQVITVNALPAAISGTATVCEGLTTVLTDATGTGTWSSSNTGLAGIGSVSGVVTGVAAGTPDITYTLPTGCIATIPVTVNPLPATITGGLTACPGTTTTLSDASGGGLWTSNNTSVATAGSATGDVTGVASGTSTITYTLPTGCIMTADVTINPNPSSITGNTTICAGSYISMASGTGGGIWSSSNTALAVVSPVSGVVVGISAGNPTITYSLPTGCIATALATVNAAPAGITFSPGLGVISLVAGNGSSSLSGDGGAATAAGIGWPLGITTDPSGNIYISDNLNNRVRKISTSGIITTFAGTGAGGSGGDGGPATAATFSGDLWNVLSDAAGNVYIADASGGKVRMVNTSGIISTFAGGGGSSADNIAATSAQLLYPSGLAADAAGNIYISDANSNRIRKVSPTGIITTVAGTGTSGFAGDGGAATAAQLNSPYGVAADGAGNVYVADYGNARIRLVSTTGVINTICGDGSFSYFGDGGPATAARIGDVYTISCDNNGNVYIPEYDYERLRKINSAGVINTIAGNGTFGYSGDGGLATSARLASPIGSTTDAAGNLLEIEYDGSRVRKIYPTSVCAGSTITLSDATGGGSWSSGNTAVATVSSGGVVTGVSAGVTMITYTGPSGCAKFIPVQVNAVPASISGTPNVCEGLTDNLTDGTSGGLWTSSNTALATIGSTSGLVSGSNAGNLTITYTLPNTGCFSTIAFTVNTTPPANTGTPTVCTGVTTTLSNSSAGGTWSTSNGGLATVGSSTGVVTGVSAGTPIITYMLAAGGCFAATTVTVNTTPSANVGAGNVCVGSTTTLSNSLGGGNWSSSAGGTASVVAGTGVVTGGSAGTVDISYTMPTGCFAVTPMTVNSTPSAITGSSTVCTGATTSLGDATAGGTWSSSAPSVATVNGSGVVAGASAGTVTISYTTNPGSCFVTFAMTVNQTPPAIVGSSTLCIGVPAPFTDGIGGGTWIISAPALGSIGSATGIATGISAGTATIIYTLPGGCTATFPTTVSPQPAAIGGTFTVCAGATTSLTDGTVGGTWSSSNTALGSVSGIGVVTGVSAGSPTISYTLTGGCSATQTVTVNITPAAITGTAVVCVTQTANLSDATSGGIWSSSSGSLATVGSATGVVTGVGAGNPSIIYTLSDGCSASVTATVNALPTLYNVTGGGSYCSGGTGVHIGLNGSDAGTSYQLMRGTATIGSAMAGTGSSLDFGLFTTAGTYTVVANVTSTGCTTSMSGSATVVINPIPLTFSVTGGGGYCTGGSGVNVGLSGSTPVGVSYQLYDNASPVGSPVAGTGTLLNFGLQTAGGTYTVIATITATGCTNTMTGSVIVTVNPLPNAYAVTGGGGYCAGLTGVSVGLATSDVGNSYQLFRTGLPVGSPLAGTGSALDFGLQTTAGTYTIVGTITGTGCPLSMTGSAVVTVNPLPITYSVSGGGGYCAGGTGVTVNLSGSTTSVNYQVLNGGVGVGGLVAGTGSPMAFGPYTAAGTYTIVAIDGTTGCQKAMSGSATVTVNPLPVVYNVTGGGPYCAGGTGVHIGLNGSDVGVNYQAYDGVTPVGGVVAGTVAVLDLGIFTTATTYTVTATNLGTGCANNMNGSATVTVNPLPASTYSVTGGGGYCVGAPGVSVGLSSSDPGINYQLYNGISPVGLPQPGGSGAIDFGIQTIAGTYTVRGADALTTCNTVMTGSVVVTVNPLPTVYNVTGGGGYCSGGTGVVIGLNGSTMGVSYQLYNTGGAVGAPVVGTGSAITFPLQTTVDVYTVIATVVTTSCTNTMMGSAAVSINPLPTAYTVTGGGGYCIGSTGVHVGLSASNAGINYQLWDGATAAGLPVAGTGAALDLGLVTTATTYSVSAVNLSTGCTNSMTGTTTVFPIALPNVYTVTGGGPICAGAPGVNINLSGSDPSTNYQLYINGVASGAPILSVGGGPLVFGPNTTGGSYTIIATTSGTGCVNNMGGFATIIVNALPNAYAVTGGGDFCSGGTGVVVGLSGSDAGTTYQLLNPAPVPGIVTGTGLPISFGLQTTGSPVYTVLATSGAGCSSTMTGSAGVFVDPLPTPFPVSGGGNYCAGGAGADVNILFSALGANYQLYLGATPVGLPIPGNGGFIDFGNQTLAGVYTVKATNATTGCVNDMTGSATVAIDPLPVAYAVLGGGSYCPYGTGVNVDLANSDATSVYQLYVDGAVTGSSMPGTGATFSFGPQITPGTYTVMATSAAGCTSTMAGSTTVSLYPQPALHTISAGGSYCSGGAGIAITMSPSDAGIIYQLTSGGSPIGSAIPGSGGTLNFGYQTAAGSYNVTATDALTGCPDTMNGTAVVVINPLPLAQPVTGGGSYCLGGAGVDVALGSSEVGANYQLYRGATPIGLPISGTGVGIDFGAYTTAGIYTIMGTYTGTLCSSAMSGGDTITINPLPMAYTITGGGHYCSGGAGVVIGLSNSQAGVNYQLYNGVTAVNSPVAGTGSAVTFGAQTAAGVYSIKAMNTASTCSNNMTGTVSVVIDPLPTLYNVTGGGGYCVGGAGVHVGLSGSSTGTRYQLWNGITAVGGPMTGTGSALDFGVKTAPGTYNVVAATMATGCADTTTSSVNVVIDALPTAYAVTGSGTGYCVGGTGVTVYVSNTQLGVTYQLYRGTLPVGAPVAGTGTALDFGPQTIPGTYTVAARNSTTNCMQNMSGAVNVIINPLPNTFTVIGGGSFCPGTAGADVALSGSNTGISYQLFRGVASVGSPMTGTGAVIDFGAQTTSGVYTVVATNITTGCSMTMIGSANVSANPLPIVFSSTGGGSYCAGGSGVNVGLSGSISGTDYQLMYGSTPLGSAMAGTGLPLSFGMQTVAGTYTVVATDATTGCTNNMGGSSTVTIAPMPSVYLVTGGGNYCSGSAGVSIGLSNSDAGVNYQLNMGSAPAGHAVAGTGAAISFGSFTAAGSYTVVGTNAASGCVSNMSASATVGVNPLPTSYTVTGGGSYCAGTAGVHVGLSGSTTGISYQAVVDGVNDGSPVIGTGAPLDMGARTTTGTYTIEATNRTTNCVNAMTGTVTVTVNPVVVPMVSISTGAGGTVCSGMVTTFTATAVNGGSGATYQWTVNSVNVATGNTYSYIATNGDNVGVTLTSNATCATPANVSSNVVMNVLPMQMPSVTIAALPGVIVCRGTAVNLIATPTNGGATPSYLWIRNGLHVSTSPTYSYVPQDGDDIYCTLSSSYTCRLTNTVSSSHVTIEVDTPVTPQVGLSEIPGLYAYYGEPVTFTATLVNAVPYPTYQWQVNGIPQTGETMPSFTSTSLSNLDIVTCEVTSGGGCPGVPGTATVTIHLANEGVKQINGAGSNISLVPNPNKGTFTVKGTLNVTTDEEVSLEMTDVIGQVVYTTKVKVHNGELNQTIVLDNSLANGMYILALRSGSDNKVFHVVVER